MSYSETEDKCPLKTCETYIAMVQLYTKVS